MITETYLIYLILASLIIVYVGNECYKNGRIYITNYFPNDEKFANGINNVLRTAYYFMNLGLVVWTLKSLRNINTYQELILEIANRLSFILFIIAFLHAINLVTIYKSHSLFKHKKS